MTCITVKKKNHIAENKKFPTEQRKRMMCFQHVMRCFQHQGKMCLHPFERFTTGISHAHNATFFAHHSNYPHITAQENEWMMAKNKIVYNAVREKMVK